MAWVLYLLILPLPEQSYVHEIQKAGYFVVHPAQFNAFLCSGDWMSRNGQLRASFDKTMAATARRSLNWVSGSRMSQLSVRSICLRR